jgi:hypothetical protein
VDSASYSLLALAAIGGVLAIVGIGLSIAWWRRGAAERARRAALASFAAFARRFGVEIVPGVRDLLPYMVLAGPHGLPVTVGAQLVDGSTPMNDEPGAWVRKTFVTLAWALAFAVLIVFVLGGVSWSNSPSSSSSSGSISGGVRRTALSMPLPPYFGGLVLECKRGLLTRLSRALGSSWAPLGDREFDDAFWIRAPVEPARVVLTPPVRAALLAFRRDTGQFTVGGGTLVWSRRSYATDGLERVLEGMARLAAALGGLR